MLMETPSHNLENGKEDYSGYNLLFWEHLKTIIFRRKYMFSKEIPKEITKKIFTLLDDLRDKELQSHNIMIEDQNNNTKNH